MNKIFYDSKVSIMQMHKSYKIEITSMSNKISTTELRM
jgi:hypothetical protein